MPTGGEGRVPPDRVAPLKDLREWPSAAQSSAGRVGGTTTIMRAGERLLSDFTAHCLSLASEPELHSMRKFVAEVLKGEFSIASFCAGTDAPVLCVRALAAELTAKGIPCRARHAFSSELNLKKRGFLQDVFGKDAPLFGDLAELSRRQAFDYNRARHARCPGPIAQPAAIRARMCQH